MGVAIHYRGQLRDSSLIGRLVEELRILAQQKGWEYTILDDPPEKQVSDDGPPDLRGIVLLTHPDTEGLMLLFDPDGTLRNPTLLVAGEAPEITRQCAIKTQYGPAENHIEIVDLLRHLECTYFRSLEILDEGQYWETGDRQVLAANLEYLQQILDGAAKALEETSMPDGASESELADKVEETLTNLHAETRAKVN
jgi:hypothetical protein